MKLGLKLFKTGLIKADDQIKEFDKAFGLVEKAFNLIDKSQVLKFKFDSNYLLVKLVQQEKLDLDKFEREKASILQQHDGVHKMLVMGAFIASLTRNARIEKIVKVYDENKFSQY